MIIFSPPIRYIIGYQPHSTSIPDKFPIIVKWSYGDIHIQQKNNLNDSS
jgi:hypothetical protein